MDELKAEGFDYKFTHKCNTPINFNTKDEAEHVLRVGREVFGADKVGHGTLPFRAS